MEIEKPKKYTLLYLVSFVLLFYGLVFLLVAFFTIISSSTSNTSDMISGTLLMSIPTLLSGSLILYNIRKKRRESTNKYIENIILNYAKKNNGIVTSLEISMESEISNLQATQALDSMVIKGYCTNQVNEKGYVEYVFPVFNWQY